MATPQQAQLIAVEPLGAVARLLRFAAPLQGPLHFRGGQYLIVDTGLLRADGRPVKRAYSLLAADRELDGFQLAARRIGAGKGSQYMNEILPAALLTFSGPWGRWHAEAGALQESATPKHDADPGAALIFVTDTAITAALGLLRGQGFASHLHRTRLIWAAESESYFLPLDRIKRMLPEACGGFEYRYLPPAGTPQRADHAQDLFSEILGRAPRNASIPTSLWLAGDGIVVDALAACWQAHGFPEESLHREYFFNRVRTASPPAALGTQADADSPRDARQA